MISTMTNNASDSQTVMNTTALCVTALVLVLSAPVLAATVSYKLLFGRNVPVCQAAEKNLNRSAAKELVFPFREPPFTVPQWKKVQYAFDTGSLVSSYFGGEFAVFDIDNDGREEPILRYYTYPNGNVAQNLLMLDDAELKNRKTIVIDDSTYASRPKVHEFGQYQIDETLLRRENPNIESLSITTFYLGAMNVTPIAFEGTTYIVLGMNYPKEFGGWLVVGTVSIEPISDQSKFKTSRVAPVCYLLKLDTKAE